jgi:CRP-like cAMP-binding protein
VALSTETILKRNRLFRDLPGSTIQKIAGLSIHRSYGPGEIVFSQADPGDALFGVITGRIRISASSADGREMFLNIMEPGDTFGEIALLDGQQRTATASTTVPTELMVIMREPFLALLQHEPKLIGHLLLLLCQRIRWTSGLAEDFALLDVPGRLARRLLSLGKIHGYQTALGIQLNISQEDVARFLGLSRQVINQYLQEWKAHGWVRLGRGRILIADEGALRKVVAGASPKS